MPAAYPLHIRTILRTQKSRTQPAAFRMAEPRRGYGYAQATGTDVPVFWDVAFRFTGDEADLARLVKEQARPGDMVVCLGAGTISAWANALPAKLMGQAA